MRGSAGAGKKGNWGAAPSASGRSHFAHSGILSTSGRRKAGYLQRCLTSGSSRATRSRRSMRRNLWKWAEGWTQRAFGAIWRVAVCHRCSGFRKNGLTTISPRIRCFAVWRTHFPQSWRSLRGIPRICSLAVGACGLLRKRCGVTGMFWQRFAGHTGIRRYLRRNCIPCRRHCYRTVAII